MNYCPNCGDQLKLKIKTWGVELDIFIDEDIPQGEYFFLSPEHAKIYEKYVAHTCKLTSKGEGESNED